MVAKILVILHLAFSVIYGLDFALRYNKQSSMSCAANITYDTTPLECGVICTKKYKDMCRGFLTTGSTCELCMVCQQMDQKLVLTGNAYVTTPFSDVVTTGKIISMHLLGCQIEINLLYWKLIYLLLEISNF